MTAKEFLTQAQELEKEISFRRERIERLRVLAEKTTAAYGGEAVCRSRKLSALEDVLERIDTETALLDSQVDRLLRLRLSIDEVISALRGGLEREILSRRYQEGKTWPVIAKELGYTTRWLKARHAAALKSVQELIDFKDYLSS